MDMKSKNAILKHLPYIHMVSTTPKPFGGHGTGAPPLEPPQQIPAWHHPSKSIEKQNTDPKLGQVFSGGAYRHTLPWTKSSQEAGDALAATQ